MKKMTFHIDDRQAHLLQTIARVEGVPVVTLVRTGIDHVVIEHLSDPGFQALLHNALEVDRKLIEEERRFASAAEEEQIQDDPPEETGG
jgi:hypothetical protein